MPGLVHVETTINGDTVNFLCEPRQSLLECLRDVIGMTGTKEGCNDGNCGACTVIFDGRIVTSCLVNIRTTSYSIFIRLAATSSD